MNGECSDIAETYAASPDDGLVRPFGDTDVATAEVLLNSLERISMRTVHMNKLIGDKYVSRTNPAHDCSFVTMLKRRYYMMPTEDQGGGR
jgi:hypothetical protein